MAPRFAMRKFAQPGQPRIMPVMAGELYDTIGTDYLAGRQPEPSWERLIDRYLTDCGVIINVGAGVGSYEPLGRVVIPIEPSEVMIAQRPHGVATAVLGHAEALPLDDATADCAMTILSLHHWTQWDQGLAEMMRVAPQLQLVLTFEPAVHNRFWLIDEYLPEIAALPSSNPPSVDQIAAKLNATSIDVLPVPADCVDAVLPAFWARPHAYLDPLVRAYSSGFSLLPRSVVDNGTRRLAADLDSGVWLRRHQSLLSHDSLDCGFRLIVAQQQTRT
jgi:hypothetical protein